MCGIYHIIKIHTTYPKGTLLLYCKLHYPKDIYIRYVLISLCIILEYTCRTYCRVLTNMTHIHTHSRNIYLQAHRWISISSCTIIENLSVTVGHLDTWLVSKWLVSKYCWWLVDWSAWLCLAEAFDFLPFV